MLESCHLVNTIFSSARSVLLPLTDDERARRIFSCLWVMKLRSSLTLLFPLLRDHFEGRCHHRQKYAFLLLLLCPALQNFQLGSVNNTNSLWSGSDFPVEFHRLNSQRSKEQPCSLLMPACVSYTLSWKESIGKTIRSITWRSVGLPRRSPTAAFCWTISVHCDSGSPKSQRKGLAPLEEEGREGEASSP